MRFGIELIVRSKEAAFGGEPEAHQASTGITFMVKIPFAGKREKNDQTDT